MDVELDLNALPLLEGAMDTAAAGITSSSAAAECKRLRRAIHDLETVTGDPRYPLLFDPQTAGGLLASVPGEQAESCVAALREAGYEQAAIIGEVRAQGERPEPVSVVR